MSGGMQVRTGDLAAVGRQAVALADELSEAVARLVGTMPAMSGENPGFGCVTGVYACMDGWRQEVDGLGAQTAAAGDNLMACAAAYDLAEDRSCLSFQPR